MKRMILCALAALSLCACGPSLVILHFNDTHSHLDPDRSGALEGHAGAIERAALVDSIRNVYGEDRVLLLHAGDFSQGTAYFTLFSGEVEDKVINALGYDCMTFGNHEFDNGIEEITKRAERLSPRLVCCNIDLQGRLGEIVKPCTIIEKGGIRVGIIGVEAELQESLTRSVADQLTELPLYPTVQKWADYLRKEKCRLVIVLSHRGYEEDAEIAANTRGVDMIIGGHTHTFVEGIKYVPNLDGKSVGIVTDGCWGYEMGKLEVR